MGIDIREIRIDDLPEVFHLGEQLFTSQKYSNLYRTWDEFEVTGLYQSDMELCLVAWDDDHKSVAGFLLSTTYEKSGSAWKYGYISWLGIHPDYARTGLGKRLFDAIVKVMQERGIRMLIVDTQADNDSAISFFSRLGFAQATDHVYLSLNLENMNRGAAVDSKKSRRRQ